tara:strand:- start:38904 stop:39206 length:303 start_codon:yes stop_codon:yes gene_type:complete
MIRLLTVALSVAVAAPAFAQSAKEKDCGLQADVVGAVQAARLDRVKERDVATHIADGTPTWPENYNAVVPLVTPWIYGLEMAELKENDLSAAWTELCLAQ